MSSPENQSDQYLDDVLKGNLSEVDLPQDDAQLLDDLVSLYKAETLSEERKHSMWQKAQLPAEKPKRQPRKLRWAWGLVASLVLVMGFFGTYYYKVYQESRNATIRVQTLMDEYEANAPLFDNPPDIFGYGGYAHINNYDIPAGMIMREAGMQWVGMMIAMVDGANVDNLSQTVRHAHQVNFKMLVSLSVHDSVDADDENFVSEFADYAAAIAATGVDAIEILPEANLDRTTGGLMDVESYAAILTETAHAIREANPDTLIISGAPAPTGAEEAFPNQVMNDDNFLRQLQDAGALDSVDCVGMQYLEGAISPTATSGDSRDSYYTRYLPSMISTYRDILGEEKAICVTQFGYFSGEGLDEIPEHWQWAFGTSRAEQRQWLSEGIEYLSRQPNIPLAMIWHIDYMDLRPEGEAYSLIYPYDF